MSFSAPKQLVSAPVDGIPGANVAPMLWETSADESLARQDTWLLSFIDILALLLTLFVLLLAYQEAGHKQSSTENEPMTSLPIPFDWPLFTPHSGRNLLPLSTEAGHFVVSDTETVIAAEPPLEQVPEQHSISLQALEGPPLPAPTEVVQQALARSHLLQGVDVLTRPGAVSIEISGNILFEPASAALSPAGLQLLNEAAMVLSELPYPLSVEGHTDNIPISSSRFPSNWELSSARAAMATRALIEQGIAADRLQAVGYGETRPLADNHTVEGRARNRRVSFVLQVDEAVFQH